MFWGIFSRTTCKLIDGHIVYKHVYVYNSLLMRHAVLRNNITAFVCVGEIITNVLAHIFSAALGWWTLEVDENISDLRTLSDKKN